MITYISGFKKKKWENMTVDERIAVRNRKNEIMSDPETKAIHATLNAHFKEEREKKKETENKFQKLRQKLIDAKMKKVPTSIET